MLVNYIAKFFKDKLIIKNYPLVVSYDSIFYIFETVYNLLLPAYSKKL